MISCSWSPAPPGLLPPWPATAPPFEEARPAGAGRQRRGARAAVRLARRRPPRGAPRRRRENDLLGVYVFAALLLALSLATEDASIVAGVGGAATGALLGLVLPASGADARAVSEPVQRRGARGRARGAERARSGSARPRRGSRAIAPQLQHVLNQALDEGGWFGEAARVAGAPGGCAENDSRVHAAVGTLLAEETRMGMLIGVAVGWELARELDDDEQRETEQNGDPLPRTCLLRADRGDTASCASTHSSRATRRAAVEASRARARRTSPRHTATPTTSATRWTSPSARAPS